MKKTSFLLMLSAALIFSACEEEGLIQQPGDGEHSVSIVGIKDAFDYTFHPASSARTTIAPDEVHTLNIRIVDQYSNIVYEKWYYEWDDWYEDNSNAIPDSIFIPNLGEGSYKIYASTTDNYYYHYDDYYYYQDFTAEGDSIPGDFDPNFDMVVDSWVVSTNPIYVGNQAFEIANSDVTVELEMKNISAKLTLEYESYVPDMYINGTLIGPKAFSYSFEQDDFFEWDPGYEYWTDLYMYDYQDVEEYYFLPRTLDRLRMYVYDYHYDFSFEQTFQFDEQIEMNVGDALTVRVDVGDILEGAGTGTLSWQAIQWNDLGVVEFD